MIERLPDGGVVSPLTPPDAGTFLAVGVGPSPGDQPLVVEASGTAFTFYQNGKSVGSHEAYTFGSSDIAISPNGRYVASNQYLAGEANATGAASSQNPPTMLWDTSTGKPVKSWPSEGLGSHAFSPDASVLFGFEGTHLRAISLQPGAPSYDLDLGFVSAGPIVVSPSGALIGIPGPDYTAQLRRASDGTLLSTLWDIQGHTGIVYAVAFSPDEKRIATASGDTRIPPVGHRDR